MSKSLSIAVIAVSFFAAGYLIGVGGRTEVRSSSSVEKVETIVIYNVPDRESPTGLRTLRINVIPPRRLANGFLDVDPSKESVVSFGKTSYVGVRD